MGVLVSQSFVVAFGNDVMAGNMARLLVFVEELGELHSDVGTDNLEPEQIGHPQCPTSLLCVTFYMYCCPCMVDPKVISIFCHEIHMRIGRRSHIMHYV